MNEEYLALEVRKYISKNDQRLYHMMREEYQRWLVANTGTFLDFMMWLCSVTAYKDEPAK